LLGYGLLRAAQLAAVQIFIRIRRHDGVANL